MAIYAYIFSTYTPRYGIYFIYDSPGLRVQLEALKSGGGTNIQRSVLILFCASSILQAFLLLSLP